MDAQDILDMDVQWLEGYTDMKLNSSGWTLVAAEDCQSTGTFKTLVHNTTNDYNHNSFTEGSENEKNDNNHTTPDLTHPPHDYTKEDVDEELCLNPIFKNTSTKDSPEEIQNNSATSKLESAEKKLIPPSSG